MIKTIRNLRTNRLKQQPLQSQNFTTKSNKNCHISTVNDKNGNLDNTNMNSLTKNNNLVDKSTDIALPKSHDNIGVTKGGIKKEKNNYHGFKLIKSSKANEEVCETVTIQSQYPSNTTVIATDSIINGEKPLKNLRLGRMVMFWFVIFQVSLLRICSITF